jgi:hypothetical protein
MDDNSFSAMDWPGLEHLLRKDPNFGAAARSLFRAKRLRKITEGREPVILEEGHPRVVVHLVPEGAPGPAVEIDLSSAGAIKEGQLWPMNVGSSGPVWPNFDGLLNVARNNDKAYSYVQLFRSGTVEAVNTSMIRRREDALSFTGSLFEREVFKVVLNSLALQKQLGVEPPVYIMVSLLGVRGFTIRPERDDFHGEGCPIDRDDLVIPEAAVESFDADKNPAMLRVFNRVWNAAGWEGSPYFEDGEWAFKQ